MSQEEFLLKWNDHHNSFFVIMEELCASELLTDVTLACGGQVFETHKIMLCACSNFFRQILTKRPDRHPIVFLKDVDPKHLEQLLQYMYQGEINVLQEDLPPLIETARALQVKGLADAPPPPGSSGKNGASRGVNDVTKKRVPSPAMSGPPPLKKARNPLLNNHKPSAGKSGLAPMSQLASRLLSQPPKNPPMPFNMLPTEPEPPAAIDQLWNQPTVELKEDFDERNRDSPLDQQVFLRAKQVNGSCSLRAIIIFIFRIFLKHIFVNQKIVGR